MNKVFMKEKEDLKKKHYEEMNKLSNDLTKETKKYFQMKNNFYEVENRNKLLELDNNKLKNINEMNNEYIQQLRTQNNNRNPNISYTLNYNNYYRNDNPYGPFPNNFNSFI